MHFSEDDLRNALKRKDPGAEFTSRVMARVAERKKPARFSSDWLVWLRPLRLHPAMSAAVAALVLAVAGWIGYQQHQRNEMAKQLEAAQQTIKALRIANSKLNHVFERVKQADTNPKVDRRQL